MIKVAYQNLTNNGMHSNHKIPVHVKLYPKCTKMMIMRTEAQIS